MRTRTIMDTLSIPCAFRTWEDSCSVSNILQRVKLQRYVCMYVLSVHTCPLHTVWREISQIVHAVHAVRISHWGHGYIRLSDREVLTKTKEMALYKWFRPVSKQYRALWPSTRPANSSHMLDATKFKTTKKNSGGLARQITNICTPENFLLYYGTTWSVPSITCNQRRNFATLQHASSSLFYTTMYVLHKVCFGASMCHILCYTYSVT